MATTLTRQDMMLVDSEQPELRRLHGLGLASCREDRARPSRG